MRGLVALLVACAAEAPSDVVVGPDAWRLGDLGTDPLAAHQPPEPSCPPSTWGLEDGRLEVQTGVCDYAWLVQPSRVELSPGDVIRVLSWHQGLDAPVPAEAHLALLVDGVVWWEVTVDVPAIAEVFAAEVPVDDRVPAGAEFGIHLHNHGFNSWQVGEVTRE